jgi:hypothetical protein
MRPAVEGIVEVGRRRKPYPVVNDSLPDVLAISPRKVAILIEDYRDLRFRIHLSISLGHISMLI